MQGVYKKDLVGVTPHIECRVCGEELRYFVCFEQYNAELVMAFEDKITAREIAVNVYHGTPFFTQIPIVVYRTAYPRPWLVYPDMGDTWRRIDLRIVRGG